MERLAFPWLFIGPAGTGKTQSARKMLADGLGVTEAEVYPKDIRMFKVGDDYECRVYCSPYHFELDIPDMSMQDKQILVEVLSMLFSAGDVFSGMRTNKRKLVILRRAHCLSLAAAVRLRWILETRVCMEGGTGMIWLCAREITGALTVIEDLFVRIRVPHVSQEFWQTTWKAYPAIADRYEQLDGRMDRAAALVRWGQTTMAHGTFPRIVANCYEDLIIEIIRGSILAAIQKVERPPLSLAIWIRERVYDLLGMCQTGIEFLDGYSAAIESALLKNYCSYKMFQRAIRAVAVAEPNTSYRNPVSLEKILLDITLSFWTTAAEETDESLLEFKSHLPLEVVHETHPTGDLANPAGGVESTTKTRGKTAGGKKSTTTGDGKPKKRGAGGEGPGTTGAASAPKPARKSTKTRDAPK